MKEKFVVFLGYMEGKGKESGKPFYMYKLAEVTRYANGKLNAYVKDFFAPQSIDVHELDFGAVVRPVFQESEFMGGKPMLIDIQSVEDSPYSLVA
ncbi:MAG: hypothetical protein J6D30_04805 [Clostridia bacterium]|nr:hypothetical protein [Clostridia bacterium]